MIFAVLRWSIKSGRKEETQSGFGLSTRGRRGELRRVGIMGGDWRRFVPRILDVVLGA